jgi:endonuclease/exonuclease/phosphatase family metal-dependent hydrolase
MVKKRLILKIIPANNKQSAYLSYWRSFFLVFAMMIIVLMSGCAEPGLPPEKKPPEQINDSLHFLDDPERIEIVTWNIRNFPRSDVTVQRLAELISIQQADIYCIQEVMDYNAIAELLNLIDGYEAVHSQSSRYMGMATLYQSAEFTVISSRELFLNNLYPYASRPPLKTLIQRGDFQFELINLHMKCCDDGIARREEACQILYEYLTIEADSNIIVVGDWNDDFSSASGRRTLKPFLENPQQFRFVTEEMTLSSDNSWDSYPSWPSFIDHILIGKALFDEDINAVTATLRLDKTFSDYFAVFSDHRPVFWQFSPGE